VSWQLGAFTDSIPAGGPGLAWAAVQAKEAAAAAAARGAAASRSLVAESNGPHSAISDQLQQTQMHQAGLGCCVADIDLQPVSLRWWV
jgi:beta-lactamase class A